MARIERVRVQCQRYLVFILFLCGEKGMGFGGDFNTENGPSFSESP